MRIFLLLLTCSLAIAACNNSAKTETPAASTPAQDNEKIITQLFEHFNKHDWSKMASLYADTAEFKDPAWGKELKKQTHQDIVGHYSQLQSFLPDINISEVVLYPSGDKHIIAEFLSSGSAPGSLPISLPICTIFTIENGKIAKDYTYYDNAN